MTEHVGSSGKTKSAFVIDVDDFDDDVIFISPRKKPAPSERPIIESIDDDIAVTFSQAGLNLPHLREHCKTHKFTLNVQLSTQIPCQSLVNNHLICEKCYCFVCDRLASECNLWTCGNIPHCNAFAKNATWEALRAQHKESVTSNNFQSLWKKKPGFFVSCKPEAESLTIQTAKKLRQCEEEISQTFGPCSCKCFCHRSTAQTINITKPFFCSQCKHYHNKQIKLWTSLEKRINGDILSIVKSAIKAISNFIMTKELDSACVVLEGLTRSFTSMRLPWNLESSKNLYNAITLSLKKLWINVIVSPNVSVITYQCLREEFRNLILKALKRQSFPVNNVRCLKSLITAKRWKNSSLKQVLSGVEVWNLEDVDVAAARLEIMHDFFTRRNILNYLQGTKVNKLEDWQAPKEPLYDLPMNVINAHKNEQRMVDIPIFRRTWIKLTAADHYLESAIRVSVIPYDEPLNGLPSGVVNKEARCPVKDFTMKDMKKILPFCEDSQSTSARNSSFNFTTKGTHAWLFLIHTLQVNASLRNAENMEWILKTFCSKHILLRNMDEVYTLEIRKCAYQILEDLQIPEKVVFTEKLSKEARGFLKICVKRFVVEVMIAFTCTYFVDNVSVLNKLIDILDEKRALWAYASVFQSPRLEKLSEWDYPIEIFMSPEKTLPGGRNCIPDRFFERWISNIQPNTASTVKAVNLLQMLINEESSSRDMPLSLFQLFIKRFEAMHGALGSLKILSSKFIPLVKDPKKVHELKQIILHRYQHAVLHNKHKDIITTTTSRDIYNESEPMEWRRTLLGNGNNHRDVGKEIEDRFSAENKENLGNGSEKQKDISAEKCIGNIDSHENENVKEVEEMEVEEEIENEKISSSGDIGDEFTALARQGKFDEVEKVLDCSFSGKILPSYFFAKISSILLELDHDVQKIFLKCCTDWLVKILYSRIENWVHNKFPDALIKCLSSVHQSHPATFRLVILKTMNIAEEAMINNRMSKERRKQIISWMIDVKKLCVSFDETDLWNKEFSRLINGSLKKKKPLFSALISCEELAEGNT